MTNESSNHSPTPIASQSATCIIDFTHLFLEEMETLASENYPEVGNTDAAVHDILFSSLIFRMLISIGFTKEEFIEYFNDELDSAVAYLKELDEKRSA